MCSYVAAYLTLLALLAGESKRWWLEGRGFGLCQFVDGTETPHRHARGGNRAGIELRNVCYLSISKSEQNILLFFSFLSISVTQKYSVKQQAPSLLSEALCSECLSLNQLLQEPWLGHWTPNVSAFSSPEHHPAQMSGHAHCVCHLFGLPMYCCH